MHVEEILSRKCSDFNQGCVRKSINTNNTCHLLNHEHESKSQVVARLIYAVRNAIGSSW